MGHGLVRLSFTAFCKLLFVFRRQPHLIRTPDSEVIIMFSLKPIPRPLSLNLWDARGRGPLKLSAEGGGRREKDWQMAPDLHMGVLRKARASMRLRGVVYEGPV